ncbi:hypothetical protein QVD17_15478 [Tagetes erecta]|uniref:DCD domain-containing protein n=1 Tax=Tagetes erecta TaxID=13708 RepID=A0AAD8NYN5_TARER|nr:hypothetical protein QVD17_15478 [Tagetes erecta]
MLQLLFKQTQLQCQNALDYFPFFPISYANYRIMVVANAKDGTLKSGSVPGKDTIKKDEAVSSSLNTMEEEEEEEDGYDDDEDEYDEDEDEEEEEEEEEEYDDEEEPEEEKVNNCPNTVAVVNNKGTETKEENAVKKDEKKAEEPKNDKTLDEGSKSKEKRPRDRDRKKTEKNDSGTLAVNGDKPESSKRKRASKRVDTMGMVFMCSSKTKTDCFRYKVLGLPESKKDQVLKIYKGMRLFLFDADLRLMYGIFKAVGPGGYNIEPKAFKSELPSQVRFTVLDDCLPLAEEKFKGILKENYYSRNKFEGLLKPEQVKKLCRLLLETVRGGRRSKSAGRRRRNRPIETRRTRRDEIPRRRIGDRHRSRSREMRRRLARDEERRPRSPPPRERPRSPPPRERPRSPLARELRRYPDYDHAPVLYDREPPVPRYLPPQPAAMGSPVRLYTYERPLDIPPYVRDHLPEPHTYRVVDRDRELDRVRDPYLAYSREPPAPVYRDAVYTVPPEYHVVSREYQHPSAVPEYRVSGGSRVPSYHNVEFVSDYRSAAALPEYRSRTHYRY